MYLRAPTDTFLSATTDPQVSWAVLSGSDLSINAPDVLSEFTLVIRMRAANAQGAPYEVVLNLKIEPVVRVPVSPDNDFSIDLTKYLDNSADAATIVTEPNATWVGYTRPTQRIAGRVPAVYNEPRTLITVNVMAQKGGTYVRYFGLVRAPVPVVPLVLGGQLSLQLVPFLLASEDVVSSVKTNPNSTWVSFNPGPKTLSGTVPRTLDNSSVIITALATSFTQGLDYSFQLELYIQDSSKPDTGVLVPVVASNNFTIITSKYFPASVRLSAITTVPQVSWISFDPAKSTVSGKVPDLVAGTVVRLTVNASSAATPGSEAATYSKLFNLEVQLNDVPKFNVTLGAQFGIDIGAILLSPPGDYLTSISTLPISNWVTLGTNGKTIGGVVPLTLPAGTSVAVAGTAFNPSLDSSYNKDFSLEIGAGYSITVPVLIGGDFQINLTDYLRSNDDTVKFTTSPPVDWVRLSPTPPPSLIGTVPAGYDGNEVNITILATSRSNGFTYTILANIQMFTNEAKVEIFQADVLTIDLRPLLKTPEDLVESIQKFPVADWLELNAENKSVSGTVPLNQPAGSSVNITVNGLSLQEPSASIGRLRGGMRAISPRQLRLYFPYSVLVSVKIFDRPVVSSSTTLSATVSLSSQPPRSTPPQSTGPDGVSSGPSQPTMSGGSDSSAPPATQPSAATFSSDGESGSPSTPVFPSSSGGEGPTSSNDGGQEPTTPELKPGLSRPSAIVDARVVDFRAQPVCRGAIVQHLPPTRAVSKLA
ncbi:polarity establishment/cellular polarization [Diaporthe eres]